MEHGSRAREAHERLEPHELAERNERRLRRRRRLRAGLALASLVAVALFAAVMLMPPWFIGRARQAEVDCVNRFVVRGGGDPDACLAEARRWLVAPRWIPWHREAALATDHAIAYDVAELNLALATSHAPDATRRRAAAESMVALAGLPMPPASLDGVLIELQGVGALGEVVDHARAASDGAPLRLALRDAIVLARFEDADALALRADAADWEQGLSRGAWLCLRGHFREGAEALAGAEAAYRQAVRPEPFGLARMALLACDPSESDLSLAEVSDIDRTAMLSLVMYLRPEDVDVAARLALHVVDEGAIDEAYRSPFVAHAVVDGDHDLAALLALVDPVTLALPRLGLRFLPFATKLPETGPFSPAPLVLDPGEHARAADELLSIAEEAKPLPALVPAEHEPLWVTQRRERLDRARSDPALHLRRAAFTLKLEAAMAWVDRGATEEARAALDAAEPIAPSAEDAALLVAPLRIATGEPRAAVASIDAALAGEPEAFSATLMQANLALALDALGAHDKARSAAEGARQASSGLDRRSPAREGLQMATDWLTAAMALRAGEVRGIPPIAAPSRQGLVTFGELIAMEEAERAAHRWRMPELGPAGELVSAELFVVGAAAEPLGRTVWLDRMFAVSPRAPLRGYALAREVAAAWAGDEAERAAWRARRDAMLGLIRDPRTDLLARLAGI